MSDLGRPAYIGRSEPEKIANRLALIVGVLLVLGFLQAGIKNGWFDTLIAFINS
jgi:hypothetical protein